MNCKLKGRNNVKQIKFKALNCVEVNEKFYFINSELNRLYSINKADRVVEIVGMIPEEKLFGKFLFGNIVECMGKLFLAPLYAKKIWIFDLQEEKWKSIKLPKPIESVEERFFGAISYGKKVYMLGHKYPGIVIINAENYNVEYRQASEETCKCDYANNGFLNWDYVIKDSFLYTPILCRNAILKINLANDKMEEIQIGDDDCKYVGLAFDGNYFWLAPRIGKKIIRWDGIHHIEKFLLPECYDDGKYYFGGSFFCNGEIVFTSFEGMTYKFDPLKPSNYCIDNTRIIFYIKTSSDMFIIQDDEGNIFKVGKKKERLECKYNSSIFSQYIVDNIVLSNEEVVRETEMFSLNNLLQVLTNNENGCLFKHTENYGKNIYRELQKEN